AAGGYGRVCGVRQLQRQLAQRGVDLAQRLFLRGKLQLQLTGDVDLRLPLLRRGLPDLGRRRVLTAAHRVDLGCELPPDAIEAEHLVDQAVAHPLALDTPPVSGLLSQAAQIDHSVVSRIWARNPS